MAGKRGKTPPDEGLMSDSTSTGAERKSQPWFTLRTLLGCVLLVLTINEATWRYIMPSTRLELGSRSVAIHFEPIRFRPVEGAISIAGAWRLRSSDPRFGGLSALAVDGDTLIALTDFGGVLRLPKPRSGPIVAEIGELERGPQTAWLRANWDVEAIAADPAGRGWWVVFERPGEVWLYDHSLDRPLARLRSDSLKPSGNTGVEALAFDRGDMLLFAEAGGRVLRISGRRASIERVAGIRRMSDAATLGEGRLLAIERYVTALGLRNRLVELVKAPGGYVRAAEHPIPAAPLDNFEGLAIERTRGGIRLWLVTDDDFQKPFRTVLLALDLADAAPPRPR